MSEFSVLFLCVLSGREKRGEFNKQKKVEEDIKKEEKRALPFRRCAGRTELSGAKESRCLHAPTHTPLPCLSLDSFFFLSSSS